MAAYRAFGGGMMQLSDDAWAFLSKLCTLEHMGAAEYEFGALSQTMFDLVEEAKKGNIARFYFDLGPHERKLNPGRQWSRDPLPAAKNVRVYGLCRASQLEEVKERTRVLCATPGEFFIKRGSNVEYALDPISEYQRVVGWIELDNDFLFFKDKVMWDAFAKHAFGLPESDPLPSFPEEPDYAGMKKPELVKAAVALGVVRNKTAAGKIRKPELLKLIVGNQAEAAKPLDPTEQRKRVVEQAKVLEALLEKA